MTRDEAEKAQEYLVHSSFPAAKAKADLTKAEAMLRVVKALQMKASGEKSAAAQEREAYASEAYQQQIDKVFEATVEYEKARNGRESARSTIDLFRTVEVSQRQAGV